MKIVKTIVINDKENQILRNALEILVDFELENSGQTIDELEEILSEKSDAYNAPRLRNTIDFLAGLLGDYDEEEDDDD